MKTKIIYTLVLLLISVFLTGDKRSVSAKLEQKRIRFQVITIGESANERKILSQTTIEGLPGTDFNINLQTGNFKMQARFLSDLVAEDKLKIRAKLDTRRFYGVSPANLPLYEEDAQKHILQVGFDEKIVLLPFGRGAETLKIEITPTLLAVSKEESGKPLKINFDKPIPGGEINIEAFKIPHNFKVEAVLLADGQTVARGSGDCLLEEEKEIVLQPVDKSENQFFTAKLTIDKFSRNRPEDLVGLNFSFYKNEEISGENEPLILNGAGIGTLGGKLTYTLSDGNLPKHKNYELRFSIRLAEGENKN